MLLTLVGQKRSHLDFLLEKTSKNITDRGFGLLARFDRLAVDRVEAADESPTSHLKPSEEADVWACSNCGNRDQTKLERNEDTTLTCTCCAVVACGVKTISLVREKNAPIEEDKTIRADAPAHQVDFFKADYVETAQQAAKRRLEAAGTTRVGKRCCAAVHAALQRQAAEPGSKLENNNRAIQLALQDVFLRVAPVHEEVARFVRTRSYSIVSKSCIHETICKSTACELRIVGISCATLAVLLFRKLLDDLMQSPDCPLPIDSQEFRGLVARARKLTIKESVQTSITRAAIDLLLGVKNPRVACEMCASDGVELQKTDSLQPTGFDFTNQTRDAIFAAARLKVLTAATRDKTLRLLTEKNVEKWICDVEDSLPADIVALLLAQACGAGIGKTLQRCAVRAELSLSHIERCAAPILAIVKTAGENAAALEEKLF